MRFYARPITGPITGTGWVIARRRAAGQVGRAISGTVPPRDQGDRLPHLRLAGRLSGQSPRTVTPAQTEQSPMATPDASPHSLTFSRRSLIYKNRKC